MQCMFLVSFLFGKKNRKRKRSRNESFRVMKSMARTNAVSGMTDRYDICIIIICQLLVFWSDQNNSMSTRKGIVVVSTVSSLRLECNVDILSK